MNFFKNMFSGWGNSQKQSNLEMTGPSFNVSRKSLSIDTGSVDMKSSYGSSLGVSGPNVSLDVKNGGSINPLGTVKGSVAVNQNTSLGMGFSPMSHSSTFEYKKENGVSETTFNVPRTPFSFTKTKFDNGNPKWNAMSENQDKIHLNNEIIKSRQMELQSMEKNKGMLSPDLYQQQRNNTLSQIKNLEMDVQQRTLSSNGSGGLFSSFKFW